MAKEKNTVNEDIKKIQDMVFASNYGLSRDFVEHNSDIVLKSNKAIDDVLVGFGVSNINNSKNSMQTLTSLVSQSIKFRGGSVSKAKGVLNVDDKNFDPITGIKEIVPLGNIDNSENDIINQYTTMYRSFLNVTSEYRGVVEIIPEVDRAIKNIARDIFSISELSGRALNKIYTSDSISNKDDNIIYNCNKRIQEEIIDKNDLESKLKRWIYESLVCGVKPIAFIPYDYIIRQMQQLNKYDSGLNLDIDGVSKKINSKESFSICESVEQEERLYEKSVESSFEDMIDINKLKSADKEAAKKQKAIEMYDQLLDDDLVEAYAADWESRFNKSYESATKLKLKAEDDNNRYQMIHGERSEESQHQIDILDSLTKTYSETKKQYDELNKDKAAKKQKAKEGLRVLARFIDEHIDVVKPGASSAFLANKISNQKDRYSKMYNLGENYYMAEGLSKRQNDTDQLNADASKTNPLSGYDFDANNSMLGKECIIIPYSPESIVPININGEYMGFYALEYENEAGPGYKHRRRTGSFTDYVKAQGFGDDAALLGSQMSMVSYGGADPLENNLYSPLALYNYSINEYMNGDNEQLDRRYDIMKAVTLRVLAHRLKDPDLVDNKIFKDAVMTMLRNDCLSSKKVQFTFIPPEYMCYMTYAVDDDGIPISILNGTLLFAYMYISSMLSSAMIKMLKSADKEKYEVAVGLLKNAGYSIDELQRVLSTRNIYSSTMFSSLSSVIKNAGTYQRMIIPVFNDRKLYDVSQIETVNNVSPDDEFTGKLLGSILSKIYINAGMQGSFDNVDFAHEFVYKNAEYRTNILESQANYEKHIKKMIRTLVYYSTLDSYNSKTEIATKEGEDKHNENDIDISRINPELSISTMMSMATIIEVLDSAKNVANTFAEIFNLQDGSQLETARNTLFKRKIIEKYGNIVEWSDIEKMLEEATANAPSEVLKSMKLTRIDQGIQEGDSDDSGGGSDFGGDSGGGNFEL